MYIHESQQAMVDPRKGLHIPHILYKMPTFVYLEESDPELIEKADRILGASQEQWVIILGRQTERLRALHRALVEKN